MRSLLLSLLVPAVAAPAATAYPRLPNPLPAVEHNPADRLASQPIDDFRHDGATHCKNQRNAGIHIGMTKAGAKGRASFWTGR